MTTDEPFEKLERELSRARTRFRWLVVGAGLCVMSIAVLYAFGQYQTMITPRATKADTAKELRANNFVLEDANGKPRASLGMDEDGVVLRMRYENGKIGAAICLHEEKVVLSLFDNTEKPRAVLGLAKNMPLLCLYDEKEEPRATIAVLTDGPHLNLYDEKGKPIPIR